MLLTKGLVFSSKVLKFPSWLITVYCCRPWSFSSNIFHLKMGCPIQVKSLLSEHWMELLPMETMLQEELIKQLLCKHQLFFPSSEAKLISIGKLTNVLTSPLSSRSLHFVPDCLKACRTLFRNLLSHTGFSESWVVFSPSEGLDLFLYKHCLHTQKLP